jgi:hypothetical protein
MAVGLQALDGFPPRRRAATIDRATVTTVFRSASGQPAASFSDPSKRLLDIMVRLSFALRTRPLRR